MSDFSRYVVLFRGACAAVTVVGLFLLAGVLLDAWEGRLAETYFPGADHEPGHHWGGLFLALGVPLHVIFIGLILQHRWLRGMVAQVTKVGIAASGVWLGTSLGVRYFLL